MGLFEIAKGIYNVGATDWNIRDFHGYSTKLGTTYNAYLILDDKITLIDTVKDDFADEMIANISRIIDPEKIDYVISNHTEMDHSGSIQKIMHEIGEDKPVFCSSMGKKNLLLHFDEQYNYIPVKDGEKLNIGSRNITFYETRLLHWPDSMFSYLNEDRILFSSDAFGQHYAGNARFDDQIGNDIMDHSKKYFANILMLYAPLIIKLVDKISAAKLEIDMICPDHGIIWRKDPAKIINAYVEWSLQKPKRKALVIYDTMWKSTQKMAHAITESLEKQNVDTTPMHLRSWHRSDIMTEVLDAGALLIGSPTLNQELYPTIGDFLTYMKGLKPKNKTGAAFGSYGWGGEAVKIISDILEGMKFNVIGPGLKVQFVPKSGDIQACFELGKKIAASLPEI